MSQRPLADARDMFAVHTMFRREFAAAPSLIRAAAVGDEQRTSLVAKHITLINDLVRVHHSGEDKHIWPLLRERGGAEIASIVDVMEEQHEAIHDGYLRVDEALAAWRTTGSAEAREALAEAVEQLLPLLGEHLALEEERVVPLIERHLTAEEYSRIAGEGGAETPADLLPVTFGMVIHEADPEVVDMIVAGMPAEVRPVIKDVATAAYAAYSQSLYGADGSAA